MRHALGERVAVVRAHATSNNRIALLMGLNVRHDRAHYRCIGLGNVQAESLDQIVHVHKTLRIKRQAGTFRRMSQK